MAQIVKQLNVTIADEPRYESRTGKFVRPNPIAYNDDGMTAIVLTFLVVAADNLTAVNFGATNALAAPVPMTAGNPSQSAIDTAAGVAVGFTAKAIGGTVTFQRDPNTLGGSYLPAFSSVTFSGATTSSVTNTRLVIRENGATDTYDMLDAGIPADPFPGPDLGAGIAGWTNPYGLRLGSFVWIPQLLSLHEIVNGPFAAGGGIYTGDVDTTIHISLFPVPLTTAGQIYAILPVPTSAMHVSVTNTGAAGATIDGATGTQALAVGTTANFWVAQKPLVVNATATTVQVLIESNVHC